MTIHVVECQSTPMNNQKNHSHAVSPSTGSTALHHPFLFIHSPPYLPIHLFSHPFTFIHSSQSFHFHLLCRTWRSTVEVYRCSLKIFIFSTYFLEPVECPWPNSVLPFQIYCACALLQYSSERRPGLRLSSCWSRGPLSHTADVSGIWDFVKIKVYF